MEDISQEIKAFVNGIADYKGWCCIFAGDGALVFRENNTSKTIKAYRGREVFDWVTPCWLEIKAQIDQADNATKPEDRRKGEGKT